MLNNNDRVATKGPGESLELSMISSLAQIGTAALGKSDGTSVVVGKIGRQAHTQTPLARSVHRTGTPHLLCS